MKWSDWIFAVGLIAIGTLCLAMSTGKAPFQAFLQINQIPALIAISLLITAAIIAIRYLLRAKRRK